MRIAIITWYHNYNYGTYLQAYSLQFYLRSLGHHVALIRYDGSAADVIKEPITELSVFINKVKNNVIRRVSNLFYNKAISTHWEETERKKHDMDVFLKDVKFTESVNSLEDFKSLEDKFDCFICGSDQIWNPKILNGRYYLDFVEKKPKIAYADSFSLDYLPEFSKPYIHKWVSDFIAIGMRESTGTELVNEILESCRAQNVCDPTLLLYMHWKSLNFERKIKNRYIFSYFLGSRSYYRQALHKLSIDYNSQIVSIPMNSFGINNGNIIDYAASVEGFLSYIQNAEFVCVDSFHAIVFSIVYEKQFIVLKKYKENDLSSQNSRIRDFLRVLNLENRIISENQLDALDDLPDIDYVKVNKLLNDYITRSQEFLRNALESAERRL